MSGTVRERTLGKGQERTEILFRRLDVGRSESKWKGGHEDDLQSEKDSC